MCALAFFQIIENSWNCVKFLCQIYHFAIPIVFNVSIFVTYIPIQPWTCVICRWCSWSWKIWNFDMKNKKLWSNIILVKLVHWSHIAIVTWCFTNFSQHRLHPFHVFWIIKTTFLKMTFNSLDLNTILDI